MVPWPPAVTIAWPALDFEAPQHCHCEGQDRQRWQAGDVIDIACTWRKSWNTRLSSYVRFLADDLVDSAGCMDRLGDSPMSGALGLSINVDRIG